MRIYAFLAATVVAIYFFLYGHLGGDALFFMLRLYNTKIHLFHEFSIPYFTPILCGGWLLAADPQSLLFTLFQPISLLFRDQYFALQLGMVLHSLIFAVGFTRWLSFFHVEQKLARELIGIIVVATGFWIIRTRVGHITVHGLAFLPWALYFMERLLQKREFSWREIGICLAWLVPTLFLMVNSGMYAAQVGLPLALGRLLMAIIDIRKDGVKPFARMLGVMGVATLAGILISAPRIFALTQVVMKNFPREDTILGTVGGLRAVVVMLFRALFDPRIVTEPLHSPYFGHWHEWSNYVGIVIGLLAVLGLVTAGRKLFSSALLGLVLACVIEALFLRNGDATILLRKIIPPFKAFIFIHRGMIVYAIVTLAWASLGLNFLLNQKFKFARPLAIACAVLALFELGYVFANGPHLVATKDAVFNSSFAIPEKFTAHSEPVPGSKEIFKPVGEGRGFVYCEDPVLGHGGQRKKMQTKPESVYSEIEPAHYNMNDLSTIFSEKGRDAYYERNPWPLWPVDRKEQFERFLEYKQPLPKLPILRTAEWIALITLMVYLMLLGMVVSDAWHQRKTKPSA